MKKNRGYVRQLKRELKELQNINNLLENTVRILDSSFQESQHRLSSNRNRVRVFKYTRTFNLEEMGVRSYHISIEDVKKMAIEDFLHNEAFLDAIKVENDEYYVGIGSRLNVSIEVLTPEN